MNSLTKQEIINIASTFLPEVPINMNVLLHPTQEFVEKFCVEIITFFRHDVDDVQSLIKVQPDQCTRHGCLDKGIVLNNICTHFNVVASKALVVPIGLMDILFPCPKKTLKMLKHVLNFLLFYLKFRDDTQNIFDQLEEEKRKNVEMINRNAALEQQCIATEKECEEIEAEIMHLKSNSGQVESDLDKVTEKVKNLSKQLENLNVEEKSLTVAISTNRELIVQLEEGKVRAANGIVEDFPTVEIKLKRLQETYQSQLMKYHEEKQNCHDLKNDKATLINIAEHYNTLSALNDKFYSVLKVFKTEAEKLSICDTKSNNLEKEMAEWIENQKKDEEYLQKILHEISNCKNELEIMETAFTEEMNNIEKLLSNKNNQKITGFKQYQEDLKCLKMKELNLQKLIENYHSIVETIEDSKYVLRLEEFKKIKIEIQ